MPEQSSPIEPKPESINIAELLIAQGKIKRETVVNLRIALAKALRKPVPIPPAEDADS